MELSEYKNIYQNEEKHFFYVSTHNLVIGLIHKFAKKKLDILDAGCGTGGLAQKLASLGDVRAIDVSPQAIKFAKKRGVTAELGSVEKIPFADKEFDVVTSVDVIYHKQINDDVDALTEMRRVLRPGGVLILRVPANRFLMSAHDRHVHTARRYGKRELIAKIAKSGLKLQLITFVHSPIFFLSLFKIFLERVGRRKETTSVRTVDPRLNRLLTWILNLEGRMILKGFRIGIGQGLVAVATR